jgi:hypothetical protein
MGQFYADNPIDARLASWLATSTPETVGYHTVCGLRLPEEKDSPQGRGPGWKGKAVTAVLRQCYARCVLRGLRVEKGPS